MRSIHRIIDMFVLVAVLLLFSYGGYAIWDSHLLVGQGSSRQYEKFKPGETKESFEELQRINPEVIGWLDVYGTNIDYPLVQAEDDWKYVNTSAKGEYSLTGSLFLSHENSKDFSDFNNIIYGHNMTPKVMFGNIKDFRRKAYFNAHEYGDLFDGVRHQGIHFFAFLSADAYDGNVYQIVSGTEQRTKYVSYLLSMATHRRKLEISQGERIVLLSTCSNQETNKRDILVGKITDQTYRNTLEKKKEEPQIFLMAGGLMEWWNGTPAWGKMLTLTVLVAGIASLWRTLIRRQGGKTKKHGN